MILAELTKAAIESAMEADQGATFRRLQGELLPTIRDAYREEDGGFRSHLGASQIGNPCDRELWLRFRWMLLATFPGRVLRLFNRGHLEEARVLSMLKMIGCQIYAADADGNQFRIAQWGGHFGSALDGAVIGCPDAPTEPLLLEAKCLNDKRFNKLVDDGCMNAEPKHYGQTQAVLASDLVSGWGIRRALYFVVNKNTDEIHCELIQATNTGTGLIQRAGWIIQSNAPPPRIRGASPGWYQCKYCDMRPVCLEGETPVLNCRTCRHVRPMPDGSWHCAHTGGPPGPTTELSKEQQLAGCEVHEEIDIHG